MQAVILERTLKPNDFLALTYQELSDRTGIPVSTWSKWFNGVRKPSLRRTVQAATGLGIEVDEFNALFKERRDRTIEMNRVDGTE